MNIKSRGKADLIREDLRTIKHEAHRQVSIQTRLTQANDLISVFQRADSLQEQLDQINHRMSINELSQDQDIGQAIHQANSLQPYQEQAVSDLQQKILQEEFKIQSKRDCVSSIIQSVSQMRQLRQFLIRKQVLSKQKTQVQQKSTKWKQQINAWILKIQSQKVEDLKKVDQHLAEIEAKRKEQLQNDQRSIQTLQERVDQFKIIQHQIQTEINQIANQIEEKCQNFKPQSISKNQNERNKSSSSVDSKMHEEGLKKDMSQNQRCKLKSVKVVVADVKTRQRYGLYFGVLLVVTFLTVVLKMIQKSS